MVLTIRILSRTLLEAIEHAQSTASQEVCGLFAGHDGAITHVFPAENVAPNPATAYEIAPREVFKRMREMRASGLELLGIYHSHRNGHNEPSPRDIESAYYPDAAYFIISPLSHAHRPVRAFWIRDGQVTELEIKVEPVEEAPHGSS